ncbi:MAG: RNA polymerase ECF-type sigma factor, partial [uncultured Craurococcus sp.]
APRPHPPSAGARRDARAAPDDRPGLERCGADGARRRRRPRGLQPAGRPAWRAGAAGRAPHPRRCGGGGGGGAGGLPPRLAGGGRLRPRAGALHHLAAPHRRQPGDRPHPAAGRGTLGRAGSGVGPGRPEPRTGGGCRGRRGAGGAGRGARGAAAAPARRHRA